MKREKYKMINIDRNLFLNHSKNIIAITSGIGSMGKTWLAITLAHALNSLHKSVLLFDANNGLLNTDFQLGINEPQYLNDVIEEKITLNQSIMHINSKKLDVISGRAGSEALEDIPQGRMQILRDDIECLSKNYDNMILDLSSSERVLHNLVPPCVDLIIVCTNEPSNLVSTYNFLQTVVREYEYKSLQIIVNYANSYEEGLRTYNTIRHACEEYLKSTPELLGVIRRDTRVRDAIRNHTLLLNRYPNSEAAEDVINIAKRLLKEEMLNEF